MHITKGKTIAQCISDRTEYAMNPNKTNHGELISSYACDYRTLDSEFALSKREYRFYTGKDERNNIIAYQVRQSFKPGEVTPEEANQIGYDFASRFLKGKHAFVVCTHTDKLYFFAVTARFCSSSKCAIFSISAALFCFARSMRC